MENDLKIATMVISSNTYPAQRNSKMQKKLFLDQNINPNLTFWYKSGEKKVLGNQKYHLNNDKDLLIDTNDGSRNMGLKTILAFEWLIKNRDFEFLVRPTPSSYINFKNLELFIKSNLLNYEKVYCGKLQSTFNKEGKKIEFVSGSTYILNKQSVIEIIENKESWDHEQWDDVALSLLMNQLNIKPQLTERFDVEGNALIQDIDVSYYQYRCRADNHYFYPRYLEAYNMEIVHKICSEIKINKFYKTYMKFFFNFSKYFYIYEFSWKVYKIFRFVLKKILPNNFFIYLKNKYIKKIMNFKHIKFKY